MRGKEMRAKLEMLGFYVLLCDKMKRYVIRNYVMMQPCDFLENVQLISYSFRN